MNETPRLVLLIRTLTTIAIASLIALAVTVVAMTVVERRAAVWVRHTRFVQFAAQHGMLTAMERQSGIRGYLMGGDERALQREQTARVELEHALDSLTTLTADNESQLARVGRVKLAVGSWSHAFADSAIVLRDSASREHLRAAELRGSAAFDSIRAGFADIQSAEGALYTARAAHSLFLRQVEVALVIAEAVFLIAALLWMRRELLARATLTLEQQEKLEEQAIELEAQALEQEALTADLEIANQELTEATTAAEDARDSAIALEERYRMLFDRNPVPMWVFETSSLRFLAVNQAAIDNYGYSNDEFLRMTLDDIRPPEDVAVLRNFTSMLQDGLFRTPGWRHRRKDGTLLRVDIVTHALEFAGKQARIAIAIDVTARMNAESTLRERNDMLRAVVEDSPLAIVVCTPDLIITRWNDAASDLLKWTPEEAIGQSMLALMPDDRQNEYADFNEQLRLGQIVTSFETQRRRRDGVVIDVSISLGTLRSVEHEVVGYVSIIADVTERKRLEAQYRQAQKMEAIGQLAGGVAHDFNNLLTVITSYSQMLLAEMKEDAPQRGDINEINRAAQRAALLTKQLLAFSRQQMLRPQVLDLNLVIGDLEQMLRRLLREDISIVIGLDPLLGAVEADPGQIEQILMNLVVNARDAMPNGGRLSIETANVEFDSAYQLRASDPALQPGRYVMIAVSDNGVGMTREVQAHVFEPFFTTKQVHQGTGLGLSTVYGIVKQSGGHLTMYSEVGHGTIFKIYLPRRDSVPELEGQGESEVSPTHGGETVLLVEDDEALRVVACRALRQCGYTVISAPSGREALRVCDEQSGNVHLIVTDVVMPEMSGAELAERVAERHPRIKMLLMSGYTRDEAARQGIASERMSFLEKPFTPKRLAAKVREVLDGGRTRSQASASTLEQSW